MRSFWKMKLTGIFIALLLAISGCSSNAVPTTSTASAAEQHQTQTQDQQTATSNDTAPTTVVPGQKLKVSYIDVGQADSILIQIPNGKNVLIDAGNNGDANAITSYLKKQDVSKLDIVIATHPHEDHIGSMDTQIKTFDIGQVIMPKKDSTTQTYKDLITAIQNKGLKITEAKAGLELDLGSEVNALLLAPNSANYEDVNNYSAVLKLSYGTNTFLFEGDAQEQSENEMINAGYNLKSDVLKVGHHGSNTSSTTAFLTKVQPKYAVISVGKGNSYGHPANVTMDSLTNIGAKVYRADLSGTIVAESDGTNITINTIATEVQPRAPTPTVSQSVAPVSVAPAPAQATASTNSTVKSTPTPTSSTGLVCIMYIIQKPRNSIFLHVHICQLQIRPIRSLLEKL
ncbi:MBL fold metallo-hydrolase [Desulfosporosinus sp. OT]|uniref:MBL fold metallo-hydrolase n=1 Tax=Desulfosporosinus sp. OT TaxID=913865 RepID=UPI000223A90E|nr:MBL fold metallo-hydrolase [Desulfosporosinus sp. OT]EGW39072.1 metallo-beta-lactamase superfamily protein [Desulfosporosinus sp. OT]